MWNYQNLILKIMEEVDMDWLTNEALFYGGLGLIGISLVLGITYFCVSKVKTVKLKAQLDSEYGKN